MIFVTGATGLVGARIAFDLLQEGERLRLLRRASSDIDLFIRILKFYNQNQPVDDLLAAIEWIEGDVLDRSSLDYGLQDCSHCIHAAAMVSFHPRDREQMYEVNGEGTSNVVNACLKANVRLGHVSSVAAIGRTSAKQRLNETADWVDSEYNTAYAKSKYRAEMEVWRGIEEGLDAVIVNPVIVLGAGSAAMSSGTLFGTVQRGVKYFTNGTASLVDVRDVSQLMIRLTKSDISAERFVLSAGRLRYRSMLEMIAEVLGKEGPSKKASKWMLSLAWRAAWLKDVLTRSKSPISRETARSATSDYRYDSQKIKTLYDYEFIQIKDAIAYHGSFFAQLFSS